MGDFIELIERVRSLEGDLPAWLQDLASAAAPLLGRGHGVSALAVEVGGGRLQIEAAGAAGGAPDLAQIAVAANRLAPPDELERLYRSGFVAGVLSEILGPDSDAREVVARTSGGQFRDTIGLVAPARAGRGVALSAPVAGLGRMTTDERRRWAHVAAHLGAGLRLRDALATPSLDAPSVEAVFEPGGRLEDARGAASAPDARERLREAVRCAERARGSLRRRDPSEALDLWQALVSGTWSLVDHFEQGGRRFVVAHRNPPAIVDPRGLSARERRAAELLGRGYAAKEIAYGLGLAHSTIANALGRARAKLGLRSLAELAAWFAPDGLCTRFAEYELGGESLAVASTVLLDAGRMAEFSEAERDVALLLLQGATNREIASRRGVAERTVANQVQSLYRKVGVASRAELAAALERRGSGI
jgi:DNA-binding CsgD family transcriptional regulator